ncbi:MAG: efflux RND transporter periplasmic adaptor subunit [Flavobacteriaceae bacterium]|nr:efflux RND transporter periplasmic adaptor subunit [Flavobacteriaceae bacterium]
MKKIYTIIILTLILSSCGEGQKKSVESVIESNDLTEIRNKKAEIVSEQKIINDKLKQLDEAIAKLDHVKKVPLITTFKANDTLFNHYLELQGSVNTKNLLVIYPEFSGILTDVYVKEGQNVKKGQLLAKIDDGGLSQQLSQLEIQSELAKTTFERQQRLWEQKIGSELQFLQAQSNYEAQSKAVSQLQQQVEKTFVRAPFSGTIDDVITDQGSVVFPGQTQLMRIVNLSNMYIETDVPEKYISKISKNKSVLVEFPVLGKTMQSKIRQVGHYINPANRTFKVEIAIPNTEKHIKPNLTAKLKINDYSNKNAILIPQSIISENAKGEQYIFVVRNKNNENEAVAEKIFIKTGQTQGDNIEILNGLISGDEIINEGARSVKDGQAVKILNQ